MGPEVVELLDSLLQLPPPLRTEAGVLLRDLGRRPYAPVRAAMQSFTARRHDGTPDELWLVEHDPVYTLGQAGRIQHLRAATEIPLVRTERGGQITFHGPGQAIVYVLVNLRRAHLTVRGLVAAIEAAVIKTLADYNVRGSRKDRAPGVYVEHEGELQKIAALGLKISRQSSYHGVALNVAMDLAPFAAIDPCGYADLKTIDLRTLGVEAGLGPVQEKLALYLARAVTDRTEHDSA